MTASSTSDDVVGPFGGLLALDARVDRRRSRPRHRAHRPERRGQDHAVQRHHRPAAPDLGPRRARRRRHHAARGRTSARGSASRATFQRLEAFGSLTARENVLVASEMRRRWAPERYDAGRRRRRAARAGRDRRRSPTAASSSLPTGTARLVELARALGRAPEVLLLDEPSSGLDEDETDALGAAAASSSRPTASASCSSSTTCRS